MSLIKTSLLNSVAVTVRMLTLLGINKIMAIYIGPIGYAMVGQFYNAVQVISTFASGAINLGVVRFTAEYSGDESLQQKVWKTSGSIALIGSLLSSFIIILFNKNLAVFFLKDESLGGVFVWFGASLTFFVFNTLLSAILNGKKEVRKYVVANVAGSLISLALTVWLAISYKLYGSLVALGIYQSLAFFVTLYICLRSDWFKLRYLFGRIDSKIAKNLIKYTFMALTTAVCTPFAHILIRKHLGQNLSWEAAGYWEAMWKFSSAYLMLLTSTLSVYYLPRISELQIGSELKKEIIDCFKIVVPASIFLGVVIYFLRFTVIDVLFTAEFYPVSHLFFWQLIGDTLKIASWIFSFVFAAKSFMWLYVSSEIIFSFSFYGLVLLLEPRFGLEGSAMAHAINYSFYLMFVFGSLKFKKVL